MAGKKKKIPDPKLPKKQRGLFKKRRAGVVLTKDEVREIKAGRKELRKRLRAIGERDKKEFEMTASSMGLYFDKTKFWTLLHWFLVVRGGWALLVTAGVLLGAIYLISIITEMRGHFTVSMSSDMFREGFNISEDEDFKIPTSHLFATPLVDVPCISMVDIPDDVNENKESHGSGNFFAYTFYLRNEGQSAADYTWEIKLNAESRSVSKAAWVMIFVDGEMTIYARAKDNGEPEMIPAKDNNEVGYLNPPMYAHAADKTGQYELIKDTGAYKYWRTIPKNFVSDTTIATGRRPATEPGEIHKYTIVVWLEGDDPDCTNELIGGHIGLEVYLTMDDEDE